MVKITDVAKKANVSPTTVSQVLSGNRPVNKKTRARVLSVIEELGYVPNPNAQALKSSRTGIIGLYADDITEPFIIETIRGVESILVPNQNHLILASGAEFQNDINEAIKFLNNRKVDGIILCFGILISNTEKSIDLLGKPAVSINREFKGLMPSIMPDNYTAGKDIADHLWKKGARFPVIASGPQGRVASDDRVRGFRDALAEKGLVIPDSKILHGPFIFDGGYRMMESFINNNTEMDSLFCANDYIACGAIQAAIDHGLRVPEDILIVGFDNREFSAFWPIPVTTLQQPHYEMGAHGARLLIESISSESTVSNEIKMSCSLIERASTGG